jgi:hypothetical protein
VHHVRGHYRNGSWVRAHWARDPGSGASGKQVTAVTIAATVAVVGITATVAITTSSGDTAARPDAVSGERAPGVEFPAEPQASFKRAEAVLLASRYKVDLDARSDTNCAAHSYGQVERFFQSSPCKWLARAYLAVSDSHGDAILVAISWVDMSNTALAEKYKMLVDRFQTGNVTELSRETGPYQKVAFSGMFYASGIDGTAVWNAQAQPVSPTPTAIVNKVLTDAQP